MDLQQLRRALPRLDELRALNASAASGGALVDAAALMRRGETVVLCALERAGERENLPDVPPGLTRRERMRLRCDGGARDALDGVCAAEIGGRRYAIAEGTLASLEEAETEDLLLLAEMLKAGYAPRAELAEESFAALRLCAWQLEGAFACLPEGELTALCTCEGSEQHLCRGTAPGRGTAPSRSAAPGRGTAPSRGAAPGRGAAPSRGTAPGRGVVLELCVGEAEAAEAVYVDAVTGEARRLWIRGVELADVNPERERPEGIGESDWEALQADLAQLCPRGLRLPAIVYEEEGDRQVDFFDEAYLDAVPRPRGETLGGATGIAVLRSGGERGPHGRLLRTSLLQTPVPPDAARVRAEAVRCFVPVAAQRIAFAAR